MFTSLHLFFLHPTFMSFHPPLHLSVQLLSSFQTFLHLPFLTTASIIHCYSSLHLYLLYIPVFVTLSINIPPSFVRQTLLRFTPPSLHLPLSSTSIPPSSLLFQRSFFFLKLYLLSFFCCWKHPSMSFSTMIPLSFRPHVIEVVPPPFIIFTSVHCSSIYIYIYYPSFLPPVFI